MTRELQITMQYMLQQEMRAHETMPSMLQMGKTISDDKLVLAIRIPLQRLISDEMILELLGLETVLIRIMHLYD